MQDARIARFARLDHPTTINLLAVYNCRGFALEKLVYFAGGANWARERPSDVSFELGYLVQNR